MNDHHQLPDKPDGTPFTPQTIEDYMLVYGVDRDEAAFIKSLLVIVDVDGEPTGQNHYG